LSNTLDVCNKDLLPASPNLPGLGKSNSGASQNDVGQRRKLYPGHGVPLPQVARRII